MEAPALSLLRQFIGWLSRDGRCRRLVGRNEDVTAAAATVVVLVALAELLECQPTDLLAAPGASVPHRRRSSAC